MRMFSFIRSIKRMNGRKFSIMDLRLIMWLCDFMKYKLNNKRRDSWRNKWLMSKWFRRSIRNVRIRLWSDMRLDFRSVLNVLNKLWKLSNIIIDRSLKIRKSLWFKKIRVMLMMNIKERMRRDRIYSLRRFCRKKRFRNDKKIDVIFRNRDLCMIRKYIRK